jgi:hypothetical protein
MDRREECFWEYLWHHLLLFQPTSPCLAPSKAFGFFFSSATFCLNGASLDLAMKQAQVKDPYQHENRFPTILCPSAILLFFGTQKDFEQ